MGVALPPSGRISTMPMITVRILAGQSKAAKQKIATGFKNTIVEATGFQPSDMWIVFEDVPADQWYVGDKDCT
jgi:4-oxalocrotonate tautomerase